MNNEHQEKYTKEDFVPKSKTSDHSEEEYVPTIGLEIHAELKTATKMFCASANVPHAHEPNTHVCPVCMGHPGTLPAVNKKAVESVIKVGIALGGNIATYTEFDRKNYFYPDIPKGYQISQYAYPLVSGGSLLDVAITRVHLEEDTARSIHDQGDTSLVDYNRAGVPLMELVTEPVIHDAKTASNFAKELQLLLRTLGVSDAQMEIGQMRVEANISVGRGGVLGTKVEVKNLNSFKSVESAIQFEIARHKEVLAEGGKIVQETRGWDQDKQKTFSQRKKESSHDYRYFPDPDIPKIQTDIISDFNISRLNEIMPELPSNKRIKYINLGLTINDADTIVGNIDAAEFFEKVLCLLTTPESLKLAANYLISDLFSVISEDTHRTWEKASASTFGGLMTLIERGSITSRVAKDLLSEVVFESKDAALLIAERGLGKRDSADLMTVVDSIILEQQKVVLEYKAGKLPALQFLIGQAMRLTKGSGDPDSLRKLFIERIG